MFRTPGRFTLLALVMACIACASAALAAGPAVSTSFEVVREMRVEGRVVIAADGSVKDVVLETSLAPEIDAAVQARIRSWRFVPVVVAGAASQAEARMTLSLVASQAAGGNFLIKVDSAQFEDPAEHEAHKRGKWTSDRPTARIGLDEKLSSPIYPEDLLKLGVDGRVLVGMRLNADGRVAEAVILETMLVDARGRDRAVAAALNQLERSVLARARTWRFTVTTKGTPTPEDLTVVVPVHYIMRDGMAGDADPAGVWRVLLRAPKRSMPWVPASPGRTAPGLADLAGGGFRPLESGIRLAQDVAGTYL